MSGASIPVDEEERLASLRALGILDTPAEERFDRITRMAQRVLGVPMAAVTFVDGDRQWFKSRQGLSASETPREDSFCAHVVVEDELMHVPDASADARFSDNPLVTGDPSIRFYAGSPIKGPDGANLGALCALDSQPRELSEDDRATLGDLAAMAEQEIAALHLAISDELTNLANRRGFVLLGTHFLQVAARMKFPVVLVYVDLDGMKTVNDTLGHDVGDRMLKDAAEVLKTTFRGSDVVARMGGDEFAVMLTGVAATGADEAIARLEAALAERGENPYRLRMSVGRSEPAGNSPGRLEDMLAEADARMFEHKRGKGTQRGAS